MRLTEIKFKTNQKQKENLIMLKKKSNEFIKMIATAILCIGVFSVAFMGINSIVFAAATNGAESIPLTTTSVNIPTENVPPEGFQSPTLTIYVPMHEWHHDPSTNVHAMSAEEAAELGAQYIWEMFGVCIDGKVVEMAYTAWSSMTRYWQGTVANSIEDIENHDTLFFFALDAVTGERINIHCTRTAPSRDPRALGATNEEFMHIRRGSLNTDPPTCMDIYEEAAKNFAAKHFQHTEVESIVFESALPALFERDDDGNIIALSQILTFVITDCTGREARIGFIAATKELTHILTSHNDIVPGYIHGGPGEA